MKVGSKNIMNDVMEIRPLFLYENCLYICNIQLPEQLDVVNYWTQLNQFNKLECQLKNY
jgi:hypothetical protein